MDILLSFIIAIIWGIFPFMIRVAAENTSTNIVILVMSFVWFASACAYNVFLYRGNLFTHLKNIKEMALILIILAGFFGLFLKNLLYVYVIDSTNKLNVSIAIMSLSSVVSLLFGVYIMKYEISMGTVIGILLTALGVFMMIRFSVYK